MFKKTKKKPHSSCNLKNNTLTLKISNFNHEYLIAYLQIVVHSEKKKKKTHPVIGLRSAALI